jgi:hypothetical protein
MRELLKLLNKEYSNYDVFLVQDQKWNRLIDEPGFATIFGFLSKDGSEDFTIMIRFNKMITDADGAEIEWYINAIRTKVNKFLNKNAKEN